MNYHHEAITLIYIRNVPTLILNLWDPGISPACRDPNTKNLNYYLFRNVGHRLGCMS
jgi:hypothetical protein